MKSIRLIPMTLIAAAVLAGCSSMPANNSVLEQARSDYANAQASPQVAALAPVELKQAGDSLDRANSAWNKHEDNARVDHLAYVAKQHVAIAQETASQKTAELAVANASAERDHVRLDARTREANTAIRNAEFARRESDISRRNADAARRDAEVSQRDAEISQRDSETSQRNAEALRRQSEASLRNAEAANQQAATERQAAGEAQLNAQAARQQTQDAESRSRALEAQLNDLQARKTDRGMVITLGDVVFDTNQAQLKSGGMRNVQKLADFFKQYPQRNVLIEGFTDSTGSNSHNQELSENRAQSVRTALLGMGIGNERITSHGYGEAYPVAGNDTAAGRQLNRRVEIVVSDDNGKLVTR